MRVCVGPGLRNVPKYSKSLLLNCGLARMTYARRPAEGFTGPPRLASRHLIIRDHDEARPTRLAVLPHGSGDPDPSRCGPPLWYCATWWPLLYSLLPELGLQWSRDLTLHDGRSKAPRCHQRGRDRSSGLPEPTGNEPGDRTCSSGRAAPVPTTLPGGWLAWRFKDQPVQGVLHCRWSTGRAAYHLGSSRWRCCSENFPRPHSQGHLEYWEGNPEHGRCPFWGPFFGHNFWGTFPSLTPGTRISPCHGGGWGGHSLLRNTELGWEEAKHP